MQIFLDATLFFLGASLVSFFTVFCKNYPESVFTLRRSQCDYCQKTLSWIDIIPIISYLWLFGKSRCCRHRLPWIYVISELFGGTMFLIIYLTSKNFWFLLPIFVTFTILTFLDYFNGFVYSHFYLLLLPSIVIGFSRLHVLSAILLWVGFYCYTKLSQGIGVGDVDAVAILTLFFGWKFAIYALLWACGLCILRYLIIKKRSYRFIPFLSMATGIVYVIF